MDALHPVQRRHGRLPAAVHLPVADLRLRQHRIEKRAIFYKRLLPLLEFGREREGIDLSKVVLTHHTLKEAVGEPAEARAPDEAGSGSVQEKAEGLPERDHREGERRCSRAS
jgi:hypothetical protein